jgi:hypothetical protein
MASTLSVIGAQPSWPMMLPFGFQLLVIAFGPRLHREGFSWSIQNRKQRVEDYEARRCDQDNLAERMRRLVIVTLLSLDRDVDQLFMLA